MGDQARSGFLRTDSSEFSVKPSAFFLTLIIVIASYVIVGQLPLTIHVTLDPDASSAYREGNLSLLGEVLGRNTLLFYLIFPFISSLLALVLAVKFIHQWEIKSIFTTASNFDWKRFFLAFGIWGTLLTAFLWLLYFKTGKVFWNFNRSTFYPLVMISLFLMPLQTSCEEVLFRGYLMKIFSAGLKKSWIAVLISGVLFGLMHSANPEIDSLGPIAMIYYIMTGIFLGVLAWKDNGLELSMGYHAINNIFSALILTNDWQAFQTDALFKDYNPPSFGWDSIATICIIQPALIILFSRIYGWKWKKTTQ